MEAIPTEQSEETIHLTPSFGSMVQAYLHLARTLWKKATLIFLTLHSLYGLFLAVMFLFREYPRLEQELAVHSVDRASVEMVVVEAIVLLFATALEIAVAVRLAKKKEFLEETIDSAIGTSLLLFSSQIRSFVASLEIVSMIIK